MQLARKIAPIAVVLGIAACSEGDPSRLARLDPPTPEESAAGADGEDPSADPTHAAHDDGPGTLDTPVEDSAPYLDPTDDTPDPPDPPDASAPKAPKADPAPPPPTCQKAQGYKSGKAFTICVTTIDGKLVEVNTAKVFLKMRADAKARGVSLRIVSGFRTMAQQQYLYKCYLTKSCNNGNLAAKPGYSNHQSGHALDLNTSSAGVYSYLAKHGSAFGFKRTVPSEAWHWEHW